MKKLVNRNTNQPIVEFDEEKVIFYNKFLENEMRSLGILIPHGLRGVYNGKDCVRLEDKEFQQAFREVYYLTVMDHEMFKWSDDIFQDSV
jgi:hypothetical protein